MKRAFSLVELSIVLVILGLLVGGILAGKSLISAAELRAVTTEYTRYITASHTFRDKYFALPGDMANATAVWGKDDTNCTGHTGSNATPGTCNGDGDGQITSAAGVSATGEMFRFWQQLSLAGLIEGTYSGLSGPTLYMSYPGADVVPGTNTPASKFGKGGWAMLYLPVPAGDSSTYARNYKNMFTIGMRRANFLPLDALFKPEDAWNIDKKIDDGVPGTGKVMARDYTGWGFATSCTNSTSQTDYTATYKTDHATIACTLMFPDAF
ncbi:MAG: prepilin-type N-terminal cleavage/methylation domain-containing protein [Pseudomonadota bacterium]